MRVKPLNQADMIFFDPYLELTCELVISVAQGAGRLPRVPELPRDSRGSQSSLHIITRLPLGYSYVSEWPPPLALRSNHSTFSWFTL